MGDLSDHFSAVEFRCKGHGQKGHRNHLVTVHPELVAALERLRAAGGGHPLTIVSGHRCTWYNRTVGGATRSQHLSGRAADIPGGRFTVQEAADAGFRGIGSKGAWAIHVDVRKTPARWTY